MGGWPPCTSPFEVSHLVASHWPKQVTWLSPQWRGRAGAGHCRVTRLNGRVPGGGTKRGHLWNLPHDRCLNRRDLGHVSETHELQVSSLLCSGLTTLGELIGSKAEMPHALTRASSSQPAPSPKGPLLPSSRTSRLPRHYGCPDLAGLTPLCRQHHRQPLGSLSPSVSRGWQAPGPRPAIPAAGMWQRLWLGARRGMRGLAQTSALNPSVWGEPSGFGEGGGLHCSSDPSHKSTLGQTSKNYGLCIPSR